MPVAPASRTIVQVIASSLAKHGSFEDFMVQLAARCSSANIDLHFVFPAIATQKVRDLIVAAGATVWVVEGSWAEPSGIAGVSAAIKRIGPVAADFHFCDSPAFARVFLACRFAGIKVFLHYHGEIRPLNTLGWRSRHLSSLRFVSLFANRIIAVSRANATFLRAVGVRTPIDVIYNGVDIQRLRTYVSRPNESSAVRLLSIGSIIDRKRVDVLLRAFAIVRQGHSNCHLTIVGGGDQEERCRQLARELGLNDSVTFTGLLADYPFELLSTSDIFVSASQSESFGLMFAEAMALSRPVIACRVGGIPEVVLDGVSGLLVRPGDPEAFATAVQVLVESPDTRRTMGAAGLHHVAECFDLSARVDDLVNFLVEHTPTGNRSTGPT